MDKLLLKYRLFFLFISGVTFSFLGQENDDFDKKWHELNEKIEYQKPERSKKLENRPIYPEPLMEYVEYDWSEEITISDEEIIYSREEKFNQGTDAGVKKHFKEKEEEEFDDLYVPPSKKQQNNFTLNENNNYVFYVFLLPLLLLLIAFLIYHFFFKNKPAVGEKVSNVEQDFSTETNPDLIQKSALEAALETAVLTNDFRLAVRIYYLMVLKSLIRKNKIQWKKQKTNFHYLLEMKKFSKEEYEDFEKIIAVFEWTWYGNKMPNKETFVQYSELFNHFLNRLNNGK